MAKVYKITIKFSPNTAMYQMGNEIERRMEKVAMLIESTAVKKISRGQPVRRTASGRLVGLDPSKPGEPPKVVTARLKQSVTHVVNREEFKITAQIGTNVEYSRRLELGFVGSDSRGRVISMAARPWLRPSFADNLGRIKSIFEKKI